MKISNIISDKVFELTGRRVTTEEEVIAELKCLITKHGGEEFIVDDDVLTLFELAINFSGASEDLLDDNLKGAVILLQAEELTTEGGILKPNDNEEDKKIFEKLLVSKIEAFHPDLIPSFRSTGVSFLREDSVVLGFEHVKKLQGGHELIGHITFPRIRDQYTLDKLLPKKFSQEPFKWAFVQGTKHARGGKFTTAHLFDMVLHRELLDIENNVKFKDHDKGSETVDS